MFHDMGKLKELTPFPQNDYTNDGQLLGHIVIGVEMISEQIAKMPGFPVKLAMELKHCILAHHGEYEYGSPKKPALIEAAALNFADNADAKLEMMTELLESSKPDEEWVGYNRLLETNFKHTGK
jgi:3'-5' exoribonuclease